MISQTATTSFKVELAQGLHNFGPTTPDTFKLALYDSTADLGADTTVYTTTGEVTGTGYSAGGVTLVIATAPTSSGTVGYWTFDNAVWNPADFTARGGLIYNSTNGDRAVAVLDFGADKVATNTFTVQFPIASSTTAILRIS